MSAGPVPPSPTPIRGSHTQASTPALPGSAPQSPAERTILDLKPSMIFIALGPVGWVFFVVILAAAASWALSLPGAPELSVLRIAIIAAFVIAARLIWEALDWSARRYTLTDRRLISTRGVIRRVRVEIPLSRVQHLVLFRSLRERLVGAGTIGIATAGTSSIEMGWVRISDPDRVITIIRAAIEAKPNPALANAPLPPTSSQQDGFLVVGIAGGIGSGKSAVAAALADLGFLVVDSDAQAKAVLERPEIRDQLTSWWGESILTPDRRVDRSKVAAIIFNAPAERARLESLVHPLVKASRAELATAARSNNKNLRGIVVDAPLLFEAGVHTECDAIIFVDTPRAARLARVRETRNWDEAELTRREQAQLSLEEKKSRSHHTIANDADLATLRARVAQLVREWETSGKLRA